MPSLTLHLPALLTGREVALGAALAACFAAQVAKVGLEYYLEKRWDPARLFGTGGMPSSHSAFVTGLASSLGTKHGLGSDIFAVAFVLACVVMYDATGIRQHAGKHASVLNMIITELPPEHPAGRQPELKDALGHTPVQVFAGAFLGILVGFVVAKIAGA